MDIDGICVSGKTQCAEGGEIKDFETDIISTVPIRPDGWNCAKCKYHLTGPAFLTGQVTMVNTLLYAIQERGSEREKILSQLDELRSTNNPRKAKRLQDLLDKIELELEDKFLTLNTRMTNVYTSLELMEKKKEDSTESTALITKMTKAELSVKIVEARNFDATEWASQAVEFFPHLPLYSAKFRKGLHLSIDEAHEAGNQLTTILAKMYGQAQVSDLIEGQTNLMKLGLLTDFKHVVGEAISRVQNPEIENPSDVIPIEIFGGLIKC